MITNKHDIAIVGGGLAGIVAAIELAEHNLDVAIIYDQKTNDSASSYAQGGIAAIIADDDSVDNHVKDTVSASGNIANIQRVKQVVQNSNSSIKWLEQHGVEFDKKTGGEYSLHLEGGHSLARILHIKDYTGKAVISKLYESLNRLKNISVYSEHNAFELIKKDNNEILNQVQDDSIGHSGFDPESQSLKPLCQKNTISNASKCIGLYTYDKNHQVIKFLTKKVILASGGASGLYKYVTNATAGTGNTMIMAHDIGCRLENLEFTQFHPTCFFGKQREPILISEAIRGNGAVLETQEGLRIMKTVHEKQDLAPRDIVARQIYINMRSGREVYLNATHLNSCQWQDKFPYIYQRLIENDIDPANQRIPISPAAHYSCGGISVDDNSQTDIQNLYAVGEVSCTGLHGANRLASNSLLECIVYALQASKNILNNLDDCICDDHSVLGVFDSKIDYSKQIAHVRQLMWDKVGLVRKHQELLDAYQELESLQKQLDLRDKIVGKYDFNLESYRKMLVLASLTVKSAIARKDSVGSHFVRV